MRIKFKIKATLVLFEMCVEKKMVNVDQFGQHILYAVLITL